MTAPWLLSFRRQHLFFGDDGPYSYTLQHHSALDWMQQQTQPALPRKSKPKRKRPNGCQNAPIGSSRKAVCAGGEQKKKKQKSWWLYKWYLVTARGRRKNNNDGPEGRHGNEGNSIQVQETDHSETAHLNTRSKCQRTGSWSRMQPQSTQRRRGTPS